jgi:UPF0042 nucleotide-binding protein
MNEQGRRLIIVSGLSGSGKTVVLNTLEDQAFYCIDNLPVSLLDELAVQLVNPSASFPTVVAIGIDARNPENNLSILPKSIASLKQQHVITELVFIEANDDVLTERFSETRRKHPLSSNSVSLSDAITKEREILGVLSETADLRIDTSHLLLHELRDLVRERITRRPIGALSLQFISFGYKNGIPRDADFVFDVRCLPNPYWNKTLRPFSGKDEPVINFLGEQEKVKEMLMQLRTFLDYWIPCFEADNRSYLCIAFGCTGGQHRSVYIADQLTSYFQQKNIHVIARHRDI